jgi:hypothetical protein
MDVQSIKMIRSRDNRFDFADEKGSPVAAQSMAVTRFDGGSPIWWIVSDEYSDDWMPEGGDDLTGRTAGKGLALLKSLRETTPRSAGRFLSQLTYGRVPAGFRQMTPDLGPPEPLRPGVRYRVARCRGRLRDIRLRRIETTTTE